jgi:hypothetical protein
MAHRCSITVERVGFAEGEPRNVPLFTEADNRVELGDAPSVLIYMRARWMDPVTGTLLVRIQVAMARTVTCTEDLPPRNGRTSTVASRWAKYFKLCTMVRRFNVTGRASYGTQPTRHFRMPS